MLGRACVVGRHRPARPAPRRPPGQLKTACVEEGRRVCQEHRGSVRQVCDRVGAGLERGGGEKVRDCNVRTARITVLHVESTHTHGR